jgi:MFS transporter, DHA3 family, macrolide efflux protein
MSHDIPHPTTVPPAHDPESGKSLSMWEVLGFPVMRHLWFAQTISAFGDFIALYAVIAVLTFRLHANAQQVNGVQIAYLLPIAVLGAIAGVFVDRWPNKPTMVTSDLLRAGIVLLLLGATRLWHFYLALAAISIVSSFFSPAQGVAIRSAVPLNGLLSANALMQQVTFGMRIVGPAAAVSLVSWLGPVSCYLMDSASFIGSACLIGTARFARPSAGTPARSPSQGTTDAPLVRLWKDLNEGLNFIRHNSILLFVITALAGGMFVIGCFAPLTAVYVRDDLHASSTTFGFVSALVGVGMIVGINSVSFLATKAKSTTLVYSGLCGIAVGLLLMAGITEIWAAVLGEFLIGFSFAAIFVPSQTKMQQETPPALLGRVGSASLSAIFMSQIAGLVLSGILVKYIGVRAVFAVCAALLALLIALGYMWMKPKGGPAMAQA